MPKVFSDHMVVQRESPIPIWGSGAEPGQTVAVELKNSSRETLADSIGSWSVKLPAISAGGPYDLQVATETDTINFTDVLVGEVWVASGQSNMAWPLRQSEVFDSVKSNLKHPDIRLFKMEQGVHLSPEPYTEEELRKIVHGSFYQSASWEHSSSDTAPEFSAVAYYFAQNLQDSLNVPVGIIQNAIGGSPTQAWLSKKALRNNPKLKKYIPGGEDNWFSVKELHPFIASRVKENLGEALKSGQVNAYQHPFAPFYLYDHGVTPLIPYGIRGVLWYQGESNANYPDEHTRLFKTLIQDWRKAWKQGSFPFLYVQLPAIQGRNRWPEFRKGQQDVLKLPNTSMTVTVDLGDPRRPSNVHPPKKRPIGRRLSRIALGKVYGESIPFSGPKFENYQLRDSILSITFDHAEKLATTNGNSPNGLVLQGYNRSGTREQIITPDTMTVSGNSLRIQIPEEISVTKIKYGWAPYPEVNLINEAGLPAWPFKIELPGNF
ncbi:sialate O-acetylesterase [Fodinibius sediminis]|uniref:sialate O-acetylesterase n=1 Tax=Fodinibius sediminis TaxID=1214077 RepID=UPI00163DDAD7|nr:sialate O-acetylesterase [Fodinibius sediminis]